MFLQAVQGFPISFIMGFCLLAPTDSGSTPGKANAGAKKHGGFPMLAGCNVGFSRFFVDMVVTRCRWGELPKFFRSTEWPALGPWEVEEVGDSCQKLW